MVEETPKGIKRKLSTSDTEGVTAKKEDHTAKKEEDTDEKEDHTEKKEELHTSSCEPEKDAPKHTNTNCGLKCVGILPGLGTYEDSSDSDCSSDTDQEAEPCPSKYDILGRKIKQMKDKEKS